MNRLILESTRRRYVKLNFVLIKNKYNIYEQKITTYISCVRVVDTFRQHTERSLLLLIQRRINSSCYEWSVYYEQNLVFSV